MLNVRLQCARDAPQVLKERSTLPSCAHDSVLQARESVLRRLVGNRSPGPTRKPLAKLLPPRRGHVRSSSWEPPGASVLVSSPDRTQLPRHHQGPPHGHLPELRLDDM